MSASAAKTDPVTVAELAQRAASILLDRKANDVVLLSLKGVSDMTDYFLIASGTSDTHVRALGNAVLEDMKKETGQTAHHVGPLGAARLRRLRRARVPSHAAQLLPDRASVGGRAGRADHRSLRALIQSTALSTAHSRRDC